jgi:hypothetical protein
MYNPVAVQALLRRLVARLAENVAPRVTCRCLRHGGKFSEAMQRVALQRSSVGTALEVETAAPTSACGCGFRFEVSDADPNQETDTCPRCGAALDLVDALRLDLIEVASHGRAGQARPVRPCEPGTVSPADWRV